MANYNNPDPNRTAAIISAHFALKSTCQLYQWIDEKKEKFIANGCVILFEHNSSLYCFSVAHVLADHHLGKTFFLLQDKTAVTVGGESFFSLPLSSNKRTDDSLDIAMVKLNTPVADRLRQNGHSFLTLEQIMTIPNLGKGDIVLIAGYPASKTKIDSKTKSLLFKPLILRTVPYLRKLNNTNFTRGFHHIVEYPISSFRETSTGQRMRAPKPYGISGSGLWLTTNGYPKLIGILSEYHETNAILISTKIDLFLDLLRQKFDPTLQHEGIKLDLKYE